MNNILKIWTQHVFDYLILRFVGILDAKVTSCWLYIQKKFLTLKTKWYSIQQFLK